jgi:hypothetical protein
MAAQGQPVGASASTITFPRVAKALTARNKWFETERIAIQRFALDSRRAGGIPDLTLVKHQDRLRRTRRYLDLLEFDTTMCPELNNSKTRIELVLEMINEPGIYFPEDIKQRADRLLQRFRNENWGAAAANATGAGDDEEEEEEEVEVEVASPTTAPAPAAHIDDNDEPVSATVTLRLPPRNHPIWGENGIMRGIGKHEWPPSRPYA